MPITRARERGELDHVSVVVAAYDHGVELDRREPRGFRGENSRPDVGDGRVPHDTAEVLRIERIDVDVDAAEARGDERTREARQEKAVRGEREIGEAGHTRETLDDLDEIGPQGGLAAGEPYAPESDRDGGARDGLDLGRRQEIRGRKKRHPRERHAVHATEIAVIDQRDPQVVDLTIELVARHAGLFRRCSALSRKTWGAATCAVRAAVPRSRR